MSFKEYLKEGLRFNSKTFIFNGNIEDLRSTNIYDILNYDRDPKLRDKFHELMHKYNGEFLDASIVRFY